MAYACPVCTQPQVDAAHLANHVAFTAIGGDGAHETWLDGTVPEWGQLGQDELAEIVVEHAEETDFPGDADGTDAGGDARDGCDPGQDHDRTNDRGQDPGDGRGREQQPPRDRQPSATESTGNLDDEARDVLAEARELTRRMRADDGDGPRDDSDQRDGSGNGDTGAASDASRSDNETQ